MANFSMQLGARINHIESSIVIFEGKIRYLDSKKRQLRAEMRTHPKSESMLAVRLGERIEQLAQSISSFHTKLSYLRAKRLQLHNEVHNLTQCRVLMLPVEITAEIFLFVALDSAPPWEYDGSSANYAPLKLSSICCVWRAISLSTTALWTHLTLFCARLRDPFSLAECWLERAGIRPLDLYIDLRMPSHYARRMKILPLVTKHSSQWRNVQIVTWNDDRFTFPLELFDTRLPFLETLAIENGVFRTGNLVPIPRTAPHLRELRIGGAWSMRIGLPVSGLTTLKLADVSIGQILRILSLTPTLESLAADAYPAGTFTPPKCAIFLVDLHTLECESDAVALALEHLTLPALARLKLVSISLRGAQILQSFIEDSRCTVRTLELVSTDFSSGYHILRCLPKLTSLTLRSLNWTDQQMGELCEEMVHSLGGLVALCLPALKSLTVADCDVYMRLSPIVDMVRLRWWGVSTATPLTALSISFSQKYRHNLEDVNRVLSALQDLARGGLVVDVTRIPPGAKLDLDRVS